jgi:hypothetical protein
VALDSLPSRDEATMAHGRLTAILAERPETSSAAMLCDRIGRITGALDRLHEVVSESYFVSLSHEIVAV